MALQEVPVEEPLAPPMPVEEPFAPPGPVEEPLTPPTPVEEHRRLPLHDNTPYKCKRK